jgi:hypothetical protein
MFKIERNKYIKPSSKVLQAEIKLSRNKINRISV